MNLIKTILMLLNREVPAKNWWSVVCAPRKENQLRVTEHGIAYLE